MIATAFIREISQRRPFDGRNGKQLCLTLRIEIPYLTSAGTLGYDALLADYFIADSEEEVQKIEALFDKEVQMTLFFNIREYMNPAKGLQKFQSIRLNKIQEYART